VEEISVVDVQLVSNVLEDGLFGGNGGSAWKDGGEVHIILTGGSYNFNCLLVY
jgi:hypothetical protein